MTEVDRIIDSMTRAELHRYADCGGSLSRIQRARLLSREPERAQWYEPPRTVAAPKRPAAPKVDGRVGRRGRHWDAADDFGPPVEGVDVCGRAKRYASVSQAWRCLHVGVDAILAAVQDGTTVVRRRRWRVAKSVAA